MWKPRAPWWLLLPVGLFETVVLSQVLPPNDTLDTVYLREIVVTATRSSGEVLNVPLAVGIVDARDFAYSRGVSLAEALWSMPGVLAQSRAGGQDVRLTIRGFGSRGNGDRSNAGTVRGVKILVDGIPETEPDGRTSLDLVDMSTVRRIEVVRSNASTLFGNASGGVINIETLPWFQESFAEARNIVGSFGLRRHNLTIGLPAPWGRSSVSITRSRFDGWREHSSSQSTSGRASLAIESGERDRVQVIAAAADVRFNIPGPLTLEEFRSNPQKANPVYLTRRERRHNKVGRLSLQVEREISPGQSVEVSGYVGPKMLQRSERNTFRDFTRFHVGGGGLYRWKRDEGLFRQLIAGADGAFQDGSILFYSLVNGERGDSLRTNKREAAGTFGMFAQAEFVVFDGGTVITGLRYDIQQYTTESLPAGQRLYRLPEALTFRHLTPRVGFIYRFDQFHSVYANVGGGLEVPAFNEVDPPPSRPDAALNPILKPMRSTTLEAGVKGIEIAHGSSVLKSVTYSVAAYTIFINDEIVPFDGGAWYSSAGSSLRYGVEIGIQADLVGGVSWKSALTYLQAEYRRYQNDLGDFGGKRVPGIPALVVSNRVRYQFPFGLAVELQADYLDRYPADDANLVFVPSSFVMSAVGSYTYHSGPYQLAMFIGGQNLTGEKYSSSAFINPATRTGSGVPLAPAYLEPGLPRNFFLGIDGRVQL